MFKNQENLTNEKKKKGSRARACTPFTKSEEKIGTARSLFMKRIPRFLFTNMVFLVLVIWGNSFVALKNKAKRNVLENFEYTSLLS